MEFLNKHKIILLICTVLVVFVALILLVVFNKAEVEIRTNVPGAAIFLDGREKGTAPITLKKLTPGRHVIQAKKKNFGSAEKKVDLKRGKNSTIEFFLYPEQLDELPVWNEEYKIEYQKDNSGKITYQITLYPIINRPDQYESYLSQLKKFKQDALSWLAARGITPPANSIQYLPTAASSL